MLRYYQSYDKLKPHDGCKELCHRLGFVSVLTHGPQLDIDVLKVYNAILHGFMLQIIYTTISKLNG
jgi:hypothetical protein